ncbi:DUF3137 domain-containing protein [Fluviicola taffensis]|uniref:Galanin n=1 Tax=Fluviicola taffensis (strain DSM 16823 / NCIMB 13979 / RW262) TaxID=755732 RepID=F2IFK2_FLUTR|nr:DUF3137 domain-containing protein [Fluviicola taffensis]AEA45716.1 galanin [Fluviicola taffensis DSM 16823]
MKTIKEFEFFYEKELVSVLKPLDNQRKSFLKKFFLLWFLLIVLIGVLVFFLKIRGILIGVSLLVVGWFIFRHFYRKFKKKLKTEYKNGVINRMISFLDSRLEYNPEDGISRKTFVASSLFTEYVSKYSTEDLVTGLIGETAISFAEVHAQTEHNDSGQKSYHDIFRGLFFAADFNKHFHSRTVVVPDFFENSLGGIGRYIQKNTVWGGTDPLIKLEDPQFEKYFAVYGLDEVEARYILTPSLMQRLTKFRLENGYIWFSFVDGHFFLALPVMSNLFDPRMFKSALDPELLKKYVSYVSLMISIVEDLNLNTRIWSK